VNQILPKIKLFLNAFGLVNDLESINFIPPEISIALDNLSANKKHLSNLIA
jgi:hypothetical protein